jgi:MerR family transcriptional regulator, light-induced transcriptional regulator
LTNESEHNVRISIGELAARTGVAEGTLRMWERRHGFPVPERLPSGHRRYRAEDVERVAQALREREAGLSIGAAIERARRSGEEIEPSMFAGIRRRRPDLHPVVLRKPLLLALTRAIEDESCVRAERALLFGSFQRERFYRASARRWRDFARTAALAVVFADFERFRPGPPAEIPVDRSAPLTREWAVVCWAPGHAVCLTALELPTAARRSDGAREFEVLWSVEPDVVRAATEISLGLLGMEHPELAGDGLPPRSTPALGQQLRLATAISTRAFGRLS